MENTATRPQINLIKYDDIPRDDLVKIRVLIYSRYSTDNQSATSTEDQARMVRRAVQIGNIRPLLFEGQNFEIVGEFKDEAVSGFGVVGR